MQDDGGKHELHPKDAERLSDSDTPLWGQPVIYDFPAVALRSVSSVEKEAQRLRLLPIAKMDSLN